MEQVPKFLWGTTKIVYKYVIFLNIFIRNINIYFYIWERFLYFEWTVAKLNWIVGVNWAAMAFQGHDFYFMTCQYKVDLNPFIKKYKFLVYKTYTHAFSICLNMDWKFMFINNSKNVIF